MKWLKSSYGSTDDNIEKYKVELPQKMLVAEVKNNTYVFGKERLIL